MNFNILSCVSHSTKCVVMFWWLSPYRLSTGTTGPIIYGLSLRDSCLLILFINIICCIPPAYMCVLPFRISYKLSQFDCSSTWGPKLGLRQMCQARYSFGWVHFLWYSGSPLTTTYTFSYYGVIFPSIFNLVTMCGFMILNCILGGQTFAAVSDGNLSWTWVVILAWFDFRFCSITPALELLSSP